MEKKVIEYWANELFNAQENFVTIPPLTEQIQEITIDDAYNIQNLITQRRVEQGQKVIGRKIGLTSLAMQKLFNVNEPDYGVIFDDFTYENDMRLSRSKMIQPKIESEIAFVLKEDLTGPIVKPFDVLNVCAGVFPCLEIIDSRFTGWQIKIQDTIADNASCWGVIAGPKLSYPLDIDYRVLGLAVYKNGELMSTAAGAAVLGDPLRSAAWLANKLFEYGDVLKAEDIILSGSLVAAFPIEKGDYIKAVFDRIGEVSVSIV